MLARQRETISSERRIVTPNAVVGEDCFQQALFLLTCVQEEFRNSRLVLQSGPTGPLVGYVPSTKRHASGPVRVVYRY